MIIILVGSSGTGKDTLAQHLVDRYGYKRVISYTTRKPREGEMDGIHYHFVSQDKFDSMKRNNQFIETDNYSGSRSYGSAYRDYCVDNNLVKILTPNGVRQLVKNRLRDNFFVVYLQSPLTVKCKRYIEREKKTFDIDKLIELTRRSIADEEMFRGFKDEADLIVDNDDTTTIEEIANVIINEAEEFFDKK